MFHFALDTREQNLLLSAVRRSPTGGDLAMLLSDGDACPALTRAHAEEAVRALGAFVDAGGNFTAPAGDLRDRIAARLGRLAEAA